MDHSVFSGFRPSHEPPGSYAWEQTFNDAGQESSWGRSFVNFREARFWVTSGWPTIHPEPTRWHIRSANNCAYFPGKVTVALQLVTSGVQAR